MQLTRRGKVVVGVVAGGFLFALLFGSRALNAIVVPGAVALAAGYVQVRVRGDVRVTRDPPADGFAGESGEVTLSFADVGDDSVARPFVGVVRDQLDEGLVAVGEHADEGDPVLETAVGTGPVTYEVGYERRGERTLGPTTVTATDVLGLFERELYCPGTDSMLVYPRIRRLSRWGRENLLRLEELGRSRERAEFEELREYDPGDPLRDIHWKTTAKRDELVVKEFAAAVEAETVRIAAGANADGADWMAEAAGGLAFALLDDDVPIELYTPHGSVEVSPEAGGARHLLRLLAVVGGGRVPDVDADVTIYGTAAGATVTVGDREFDFAELVGDVPRGTGGWPGARAGADASGHGDRVAVTEESGGDAEVTT